MLLLVLRLSTLKQTQIHTLCQMKYSFPIHSLIVAYIHFHFKYIAHLGAWKTLGLRDIPDKSLKHYKNIPDRQSEF